MVNNHSRIQSHISIPSQCTGFFNKKDVTVVLKAAKGNTLDTLTETGYVLVTLCLNNPVKVINDIYHFIELQYF